MKTGTKILSVFFILTAVIAVFKDNFISLIKQQLPLDYRLEISAAAAEYELDISFIAAVIMAESGYDENATSGVAHGLMQLTDETAAFISEKTGLSFENRMSPLTNIRMGCWYLSYLMDKFSDTKTVLAAYNAGPGIVNTWLSQIEYSKDGRTLKKIPYKETVTYVRRIQIIEKFYKLLYNV